MNSHRSLIGLLGMALVAIHPSLVTGQEVKTTVEQVRGPATEFADYSKVIAGYEKVVSTTDGSDSMWTIWINKKKGQMLAELPKDFDKKKYFFALTVASGERFAGLQSGDMYLQWKRYDKDLALIEPNLRVRSTGDKESKSSVERLFTGRVVIDTPILAISPKGGPVIALDQLFTLQAPKFFGFSLRGIDPKLLVKLREIKTAKAFPKNVELAYEVPLDDGVLKSLHYSISEIPDDTGYKPRKADDRLGYFTTAYTDLGKYKANETRTRYINRWHLEKADPNLKMSPPKKPIVFYIEHTTPIRYRRFVRDGILYWNAAFEKVGLVNAIEVYQQDATTNAHMEKDPEDVRYNFVRWLNNDVSTAIGPSRVHPLTGQILDADIVLTDGWIRVFERDYEDLLPRVAMEGFGPETLSWLNKRPQWDPRLLLASPHQRDLILAERARQGVQPLGGHPLGNIKTDALGDDEYDGLIGRISQVNGSCMAADGRSMDLAVVRMLLAIQAADGKPEPESEKLDGVPAEFIGPLLADLVAHEVGHTLGLRHNFAASGLYTLDQINSEEVKGKKPLAASVMDYLPVNIRMDEGTVQGDYSMIGVGPYDMWAIEYGYTFENDLEPILKRASEPALKYATDQDTLGSDPFARRYDFSAEPLDYAKNQMKLAEYHRKRLLDSFVKDGDSWHETRRGYELTLGLQTRSLSMMANWLGGTFVSRNHKGNGEKPPLEAAEAEKQRAALKWVIEHAFRDDAFGLSPKLVQYLKANQLQSDESFSRGSSGATFPVHDRIMSIQASTLTMLMNPTTLGRVHDNEFLVDPEEDAFTLPELLELLSSEIFSELDQQPDGPFTVRKPMVSSLRRNLQKTFVERLIDLTLPGTLTTAGAKPISDLAMMHLRQLSKKVNAQLKAMDAKVDPYTRAHLEDLENRITKALESQYIYNAKEIGGVGGMSFFFQPAQSEPCDRRDCAHCNRR